jgi:hypothetical protein
LAQKDIIAGAAPKGVTAHVSLQFVIPVLTNNGVIALLSRNGKLCRCLAQGKTSIREEAGKNKRKKIGDER